MRLVSYSFILLLFAISCNKKYKDPQYTLWEQFNFTVDTVKDIPVKQGQSKSVEFPVSILGGDPEAVSISLENIPNGIHCNLSTQSATPPFRVSLSVTIDDNVPVSTYQVKLVAKSNSTGTKVYPFNIYVCDINDCACNFAGYYQQISWYSAGWIDTNVAIIMPNPLEPGVATIIHFSGLLNLNLNAYLDCNNHSFFMPQHQGNNNYMIWGFGTYNDTNISLDFHNTMDTATVHSIFTRIE
ncbi:MAG: hypothetical protein BGO69_00590 [Bacteroidetes bacterium 46-16]|nr:MAG: hypothetical protein BGO69_00590 [Bacteroidetes bacterium 46-16]